MWNLEWRHFYQHMHPCAKWCFSCFRTNTCQAICERHSTPKLRDPVQQRLCVPIVLTDPTKSQRPASCFTTRAKLPQHKFKGRVVFLGVRSPSALASPNNAPPASALIMALQKCASPELPPLILFRINSATCIPHTDLVRALHRSLFLCSRKPLTPSSSSGVSPNNPLPPGVACLE